MTVIGLMVEVESAPTVPVFRWIADARLVAFVVRLFEMAKFVSVFVPLEPPLKLLDEQLLPLQLVLTVYVEPPAPAHCGVNVTTFVLRVAETLVLATVALPKQAAGALEHWAELALIAASRFCAVAVLVRPRRTWLAVVETELAKL